MMHINESHALKLWLSALCALYLAHSPAGAQESAADDGRPMVVMGEEGRFSVQAQDVPLADVLGALEARTGSPIDIDPALLKQRVSLALEDATYEDLLEALAGSYALIYEKDADGNIRLLSTRLTSRDLLEGRDLSWGDKRDLRKKKRQIRKLAKQIENIYGYAGSLDYEAAKALIEQRKLQYQELVDQLAALGPGGARAMAESFSDVDATRGKMALILALQKIDDDEAPLALGAIFESDSSSHSLQREVIASLGHRTDSLETLQRIISSEEDKRLLGPAMMALSNKPDSMETVASIIRSESENRDVRQEAVKTAGNIGGEAARNVLTEVASDPGINVSVRISAISELWRAFGEDSKATLEALANDPDEKVRSVASKMLRRLGAG